MKLILTSLISIILTFSAIAQEPVETLVFGIGRNSCATWLSTETNKYEGNAWVLGWWSGRNISNATNGEIGIVGQSTDALGILGSVTKICNENPAKSLMYASNKLYLEFKKSNR